MMPDKKHMTKTEYQRVRESIGSQRDVSRLLGVDIRTIQRREAGEILITFEATRALFSLKVLEHLRNLMEEVGDSGLKNKLDKVVFLLDPWTPKAT
jgi:hypothetical protein